MITAIARIFILTHDRLAILLLFIFAPSKASEIITDFVLSNNDNYTLKRIVNLKLFYNT